MARMLVLAAGRVGAAAIAAAAEVGQPATAARGRKAVPVMPGASAVARCNVAPDAQVEGVGHRVRAPCEEQENQQREREPQNAAED